MTKYSPWAGRKVMDARAYWRPRLPLKCRKCGRPVRSDRPWTVGHIVDRATCQRMGWTEAQADAVTNQWPEHPRCNYAAGGRAGAAITNARRTKPTEPDHLASSRARGIRGV